MDGFTESNPNPDLGSENQIRLRQLKGYLQCDQYGNAWGAASKTEAATLKIA